MLMTTMVMQAVVMMMKTSSSDQLCYLDSIEISLVRTMMEVFPKKIFLLNGQNRDLQGPYFFVLMMMMMMWAVVFSNSSSGLVNVEVLTRSRSSMMGDY
jgi:hypothetical protein